MTVFSAQFLKFGSLFRSHHFFVFFGDVREHRAHLLATFFTGKFLIAPNLAHLGTHFFSLAFSVGTHLLHLSGGDT